MGLAGIGRLGVKVQGEVSGFSGLGGIVKLSFDFGGQNVVVI